MWRGRGGGVGFGGFVTGEVGLVVMDGRKHGARRVVVDAGRGEERDWECAK